MEKTYTPMIQQYLAIKEQYQDALLFFRLGDFYELFFDDAVLASRELEITLTGRDGGAKERIPMCGVPYHSADTYVARLIEKGYKIAICEQVEDPKSAKGVVKREVVRVVTPGTIMDGKFIEEKENNYLAAVYAGSEAYGFAACDLTTGECYTTVLGGGFEFVLDELAQYKPAELIAVGQPLQEGERQRLTHATAAVLSEVPLGEEEADALERLAEEQFPAEKDRWREAEMKRATGALIRYLQDTQKRSLDHIVSIEIYESNRYMMLDQHAYRNLELVETIREKSKKGSLLWLLDRTVTAMGGRLLKRWLEKPLISPAQIKERQDAVQFFTENLLIREELREYLQQVYDIERLTGRVAYGNANGRDLIQLKKTLKTVPYLKQLLSDTPSDMLSGIVKALDPCEDIVELLERSIEDDPPLSVTEGGVIKQGYHEKLDTLKQASREGKSWIANLEAREREATGIKSLKVGYNKVFGYYIEVTKANLSALPEGRYQRKQTLANAERFVTPELKEKEALILEAEEKMVDLEYELFVEVREKVGAQIPRLQQLARRISELDALQSFATVSADRGYVRPSINRDARLSLKEARHPVVEAVLPDASFVPNDIEMDADTRQILLITGPNMAGKSTYMRQTALIVIMAQMGCFVPADHAEIPIFDRIFTRIGAADDLVGGYSTFMVEMSETKNAISRATANSLILLDEIGRGTSTYDGMALAHAVVEYIHDHVGAKTLFSTHYHELTSLEEQLPRLVNVHAKCVEKDRKVVFLHRIEPGKADKSYGIHVAELAEMPADVLEKAKRLLARYESGSAKQGPSQDEAAQQLSFDRWFAEAAAAKETRSEEEQRVLQLLKNINIHDMTPMEAMNTLYEWQKRLRKG